MSDCMKRLMFLSKGREKILEVLMEFGELNISKIIRHTSLNHKVANAYLKEMVSLGLVKERKFGRVRMFRISDPETLKQMLRSAFDSKTSS
ncbi:MAG: helix-turn-helix domain-containing protein [Nitrososphaerota archaeon]|nr:helix-turn-helix domain-containing protein [Aigarchaeota archaeon]MDW8077010.1 helix-turn-helix domain-containing protein [Nitrososphaerota archaeon]